MVPEHNMLTRPMLTTADALVTRFRTPTVVMRAVALETLAQGQSARFQIHLSTTSYMVRPHAKLLSMKAKRIRLGTSLPDEIAQAQQSSTLYAIKMMHFSRVSPLPVVHGIGSRVTGQLMYLTTTFPRMVTEHNMLTRPMITTADALVTRFGTPTVVICAATLETLAQGQSARFQIHQSTTSNMVQPYAKLLSMKDKRIRHGKNLPDGIAQAQQRTTLYAIR